MAGYSIVREDRAHLNNSNTQRTAFVKGFKGLGGKRRILFIFFFS